MDTSPRTYERSRMVEMQIRSLEISNPRILAAMRDIPRHRFIPPPYNTSAYDDAPLPIGNGQTISYPYIWALMTELLDPRSGDRVLEIGAGSGCQAAILSMLMQHVTTTERIPTVAGLIRANLAELGFDNVSVIVGDGTQGYPEDAPYDGLMIAVATPETPQPIIDQLADGGRLVAPVGGREIQELITLARKGNRMERSSHGGLRFVPLIGEFGWVNT